MTRVITVQMTETNVDAEVFTKENDEKCVRSYFNDIFEPDQLLVTVQDFDHTPEEGEYTEVDITQQVMEVE